MGFDIRLPIGLMFSVFGLLVTGYGAATRGSDMYAQHSLGIDINLWWGMVMLLFGAGMLLLVRRASSAAAQTASATASHGATKLPRDVH
ncbi:MAG: hypothetical protein ACLPHI_20600 [Terriglobales bacterium]|jgi:hypothetical protein